MINNSIKMSETQNFTLNGFMSYLHSLHNTLRNGETSLTGLPALNEINNILTILFIEKNIVTEKYDLDEKCQFSWIWNNIVYKYNTAKNEPDERKYLARLWNTYANVHDDECVIRKLYEYKKTKPYMFSQVGRVTAFTDIDTTNKHDYTQNCKMIVELFNKTKEFFFGKTKKIETYVDIDKVGFDILGEAYEKFKEVEVGGQGKGVGQYFTNRLVIKYVVDKIKPKYNEKCYDPTCGSGGFIHMLDKYVLENESNKIKKFRKNIYGNDKAPEIMKALNFNMLIHNISIENIKNKNSLGVSNCTSYYNFFDCIVGNPPYGMKIKNKYSEYSDICEKGNYWPKFMKGSKDETLSDSMGQFMIHTINSLKENGRYGLVVDRGILNNGTENESWQKGLRKMMCNETNISEIVLLPTGIFTFTNFATALVIGQKGSKTNKIEYYDGEFEDTKNKKGFKVEKLIKELSYEELVNKNYSLKIDDYQEKEDTSYEGIEYKKLGEICDIKYGTRITKEKNSINETDEYVIPVYGGGGITFYTNKHNRIGKTLIISRFGVGLSCVRIIKDKLFLNDNGMFIDNYKINDVYLDYYLLLNMHNIYKFTAGQAQKLMETHKLKEQFKVPIVSKEHQERIVDFMDKTLNGDYKLLDKLVTEFKDIDLFKFLLCEDYDTMQLVIEYGKEKEYFKTTWTVYKDLRIKGLFKTVKSEKKKLGDLVEFKKGNYNTKDVDNKGKYPYYNSGYKNPSGSHSEYTINEKEYIIFIKDGGNKSNPLSEKSGMAKSFYCTGKSAINSHNLIFIQKDINMTLKYLYYYLEYHRKELQKKAKYNSGLGSLVMNAIKDHIINIPTLDNQHILLKQIEDIENEESEFNKRLESTNQMIKVINQNINTITFDNGINLEESNKESEESDKESEESESEEVESELPNIKKNNYA
jgi:type I restriction-modification system DNA methylase subunit